MFCTNCGKQIPDGSLFCPVCGSTLAAGAGRPAAQAAPRQSARDFLMKGGKFSCGLTRSPISIAMSVFLLLLIVFMFQPWISLGGAVTDSAIASSTYTDSQTSQMLSALGGFLTMPYLTVIAIFIAALSSGSQDASSIISQYISIPTDDMGAGAVFAQIACWLFFALWIACIVLLALAFISNIQGTRRSRERTLRAVILTMATSVAWIIVAFIMNAQLVGAIRNYTEQVGGTVDDIPGFIIVPSAWVWVIAVLTVLGIVGLTFLAGYLRDGTLPFGGGTTRYPSARPAYGTGAPAGSTYAGGSHTAGYPSAYPTAGYPTGNYPAGGAGGYHGDQPR